MENQRYQEHAPHRAIIPVSFLELFGLAEELLQVFQRVLILLQQNRIIAMNNSALTGHNTHYTIKKSRLLWTFFHLRCSFRSDLPLSITGILTNGFSVKSGNRKQIIVWRKIHQRIGQAIGSNGLIQNSFPDKIEPTVA